MSPLKPWLGEIIYEASRYISFEQIQPVASLASICHSETIKQINHDNVIHSLPSASVANKANGTTRKETVYDNGLHFQTPPRPSLEGPKRLSGAFCVRLQVHAQCRQT